MKLKRKEFMVGAAMGLVLAAVATAGGAIDWPAGRLPASASQPYGGRFIQTGGQPIFAPPPGAPLSFADIVERVGPAVVQISTRSRVDTSRLRRIPTIPGLPPGFAVPPGGAEPEVDPEDAPQQLGEGSGFFISADGYIVTNNHVVADAEEIKVKLSDERELTARLIGRDEATDLAVIKVEGDNFSFVTFEEEARPRVGDWVIAIGNPYGFGATVTAGIVSAFGRDLSATGRGSAYNDFIQIDAAINRGNSGGPTFDTYGRVIGVNSQIFSPTGGSVGIGFAIPAETAKSITDQLVRNGRIERGYIGVSVGSVSEEIKESLGLRNNDGAYVSSVTPGGPADRGGVQPDDIITSVNGERVTSSTDLTRRVGAV
ncbi:MAG TPA: trypsin-like peptidase domain-containing protein, partial [Caulobacteraceae bacterium]